MHGWNKIGNSNFGKNWWYDGSADSFEIYTIVEIFHSEVLRLLISVAQRARAQVSKVLNDVSVRDHSLW